MPDRAPAARPQQSPAPDLALAHRTTDATFALRGAAGNLLSDLDVVVEQTRHAIAFGNIGFDFIGYANDETRAVESPFGAAPPDQGKRLADLFVDMFNTATLPFYWAGLEPARGLPDTARLMRTAQWLRGLGVELRGHPLVRHTLAPSWQNALTRLCRWRSRIAMDPARVRRGTRWPSTPDGEARQADELVRHYRTLVSHPAVEAITYWGPTDVGAWLGAPVGLVRADGTTKPAYDALRGLLKDGWWLAPTTSRTAAAGRAHPGRGRPERDRGPRARLTLGVVRRRGTRGKKVSGFRSLLSRTSTIAVVPS